MADKSTIEWTDATWNPVRGCSLVSDGCRNCYAMREAHRLKPYRGLTRKTEHGPVWTGEIRLVPEALGLTLHWKKPKRIFVNSMSDLFHEKLPDEFILECFRAMKQANQHIFQILTKRPERMQSFMSRLGQEDGVFFLDHLMGGMTPHIDHIWLGVSVENQKSADERIPLLLQTPAAVRWISAEPLLGPVDLSKYLNTHICADCGCICPWRMRQLDQKNNKVCPQCSSPYCEEDDSHDDLDWVVVGGESGPNARPTHPDWVRSIRDQCRAGGVPFFFKQWGEWLPLGQLDNDDVNASRANGARIHLNLGSHFPGIAKNGDAIHVGKKAAGAMLDGREWREFPK